MSQGTYITEDADSEVKTAHSGASIPKKILEWLKDTLILKLGWRVKCELAVVIVLVFIVWGLLSLPIVFYFTTKHQEQNEAINQILLNTTNNDPSLISINDTDFFMNDIRNGTHDCLNKYTGSHCLSVLQELTTCESADSGRADVYISNFIADQNAIEEEIGALLFALETVIKPSDECRNEIIPFFCLYKFGLCGENNADYRPTVDECSNIRDSVCESKWMKTAELLEMHGLPPLPDCSRFSDDGLKCDVKTLNDTPCKIECHKHFYCENNFCKPRCDRFRQYSDEYVILSDVLMILSGSIGLLCGIVVVVIFVIRYKTMMVFPIILIFYMTISILAIEINILIALMDRSELFCNSIDLLDSLKHPTPFCKFSGVVGSYLGIQAALLWLFYIFATFWKIQFPFHSSHFDNTKQTKYIHAACAVLSLILPIIPAVLISVEGGFIMSRFPPIGCVGRYPKSNFYGIVFPVVVMFAVGTTVLLAILWVIRRSMIKSQGKSGSPFRYSPAECKIFLMFVYYLLNGVLQLIRSSINAKYIGHNADALSSYFNCQRLGYDSKCSLHIAQNPALELVSIIYFLLFPAVSFVYAIRASDVKMMLKLCSGVRKIGI